MKDKPSTRIMSLIALLMVLTSIAYAQTSWEQRLAELREQYADRTTDREQILTEAREDYADRVAAREEILAGAREDYAERTTDREQILTEAREEYADIVASREQLIEEARQDYADRTVAREELIEEAREQYANRLSASDILARARESAGDNPTREEIIARIRSQLTDYPDREQIISTYYQYQNHSRTCHCICTCSCSCTCPEPTPSTTTTTRSNCPFDNPCRPTTTRPSCTTTTTLPKYGSIRIFKFNDHNDNGLYEPEKHEEKLAGFRFYVSGPKDYTVITDENGEAVITGMPYGRYKVKEDVFEGWKVTTKNPQEVNIDCGGQKEVSFGNRQVPVPLPAPVCGKLRIVKYNDANGNKVQDCGEEGLGGVKFTVVQLKSRSHKGDDSDKIGSEKGGVSAKCEDGEDEETGYSIVVVTNCSGEAVLECLPTGRYMVHEEVPSGWTATTAVSQKAEISSAQEKTLSFGNKQKDKDKPSCRHLCYRDDCNEYRNEHYCGLYPQKCAEYRDCESKSYSGLVSCGGSKTKAGLDCPMAN